MGKSGGFDVSIESRFLAPLGMTPSSRNAPCPCGSGRRYKECHGALADPSNRGREEPPRDAQRPFGQGENHHTEASLRRLLADEPENVAAWNRLPEPLIGGHSPAPAPT